METVKRVAVIGAGPAGAIVTDALVKENAFATIRVFERQSIAGGTWVYHPEHKPNKESIAALLTGQAEKLLDLPDKLPCTLPRAEAKSRRSWHSETASHDNLHSNLPPDIMGFTQERIPEVVSERMRKLYGPDAPFRHREVMREWVENIFNRGEHQHLVQYRTAVERAEKRDREWILTLRQESTEGSEETWWQESFDAVVVATGHYYVPYLPAIPGLIQYFEKYPERIMHSKNYPNLEVFREKRVVVVGGSVSAFDALHDIKSVSKLPIISSLRRHNPLFGPAPFTHPEILNRPVISNFDAKTGRITFSDGSVADEVDIVLFATGFEFDFPFLPDIKPVNGRIPGLYQNIFKASDPSLAFIGMVTGGFGIRIFEWQAVAAARVLSDHARLPSQLEMEEWERQRVAQRGDGPPYWTLMPDFEVHFEDLRRLAGEPSPGTNGRVLPAYNPEWAEEFWRLIHYRIDWWKKKALEAQETTKNCSLEAN